MSKLTDKLRAEWQDVANLALGAWLVASPWVLAYEAQHVPTYNAVVVGVIIAAAAAGALYAFQAWEEWINVAFAAWLIVSPWILGFITLQLAMLNQIIIGVAVGLLALWSANIEHGTGGRVARG
jgi:SPW repeat